MGLDITAYERVTVLPEHEHVEECYEAGHVVAYVIVPGFEPSLRGLLPDRCYLPTGESLGFQAGSYSGYNQWREALCQAAHGVPTAEIWRNPKKWADAPFFELLNFADNEGTIGPEAAADLYLDFVAQRVSVRPRLGEWEQEKYDDWSAAFEMAAGTGLVRFY